MSVTESLRDMMKDLLAMMRTSADKPLSPIQQPAGKPTPKPDNAAPGQSPNNAQGSMGSPDSSKPDSDSKETTANLSLVQGQNAKHGLQPGHGASGDTPALDPNQQPDPTISAKQQLVPLRPTRFKGEATVQVQIAPGQVKTRERTVMPSHQPVAEGAEQGTVPVQYRHYVQHYFDR
jgi:hypothetical protein